MTALREFYNTQPGADLENWLADENNLDMIYGMRILYIVGARLDNESNSNEDTIYKFGVAHNDSIARLKSYIVDYGLKSETNPASGVKLYYLAGNKYNSSVEPSKSVVASTERFLKKFLKAEKLIKKHRGSERTFAKLRDIKSLIKNKNPEIYEEDIVTPKRSGLREVRTVPKKLTDDYYL